MHDTAYVRLRDGIVAGEFQPNEHLIEADLGKTLGLSRSAVRTALLLLEQDGLVLREPNRGARVRLISEDEAVEILEAREALEGLAARNAARKATQEDVIELREIVNRMARLLEQGDLLSLSDESAVLHARIVEIAGHRTVSRLIALLKSQTVRFQYRTILAPGRSEDALLEHTAIVDAIAAHEPETAEAVMRTHVRRIREALQGRRPPASGGDSVIRSDADNDDNGATPA